MGNQSKKIRCKIGVIRDCLPMGLFRIIKKTKYRVEIQPHTGIPGLCKRFLGKLGCRDKGAVKIMRKILYYCWTMFLVVVAGVIMGAHPCGAAGKVLLILDGSGSMWGQLDGKAKIVVAKDVMADVIKDLPEGVKLGLMAYGHRRKGDCDDIEVLVPANKGTIGEVVKKIRALNPKGKTPITRTLKMALEKMEASEEETTVLLVSDGKETCDEDPCKLIREYKKKGVRLKVHVVGFDVTEEEKTQLACIANEGGGQYFSAQNADQLSEALMTVKTEVVEAVAAQTETANSNFKDNPEGWKIVGDGALGKSANPTLDQGAIQAFDHATGGVWFWKAPKSFLGDKRKVYGLDLVFKLKVDRIDSPFDANDIVIKGAGITVIANTVSNPGTDWTSYRIGLHESAGWRVKETCKCATREELLAVLAEMEMLLIRGEFRTGNDTGWLDDVVFGASPGPQEGEATTTITSEKYVCPSGILKMNGPASVYTGSVVKFSFEALTGFDDTGWIGMVPHDIAHGCSPVNDEHNINHARIKNRTQGTVTLHAPVKPGTWDARLISSNKNHGAEVAFVTFEVVKAEGKVSLEKDQFVTGEVIKIHFEVPEELNPKAWLGFIPSSVPHGSENVNDEHEIRWAYLNGKARGSVDLVAPTSEGKFDVRLHDTNNGGNEIGHVGFEIVKASGKVSLEKDQFAAGEKMKIHFEVSEGLHHKAWLGIFPASLPHGSEEANDGHEIGYSYLGGKATGIIELKAPLKAGEYDVRVHDFNEQGNEIGHVKFKVR